VRLGVELVEPQEAVDLGVIAEPEPVPVDHRIAAQHEPHRLFVGERQLVGRRRAGDAWQDGGDHRSSLSNYLGARVKRRVAVNRLITPSPAMTFPTTAIISATSST